MDWFQEKVKDEPVKSENLYPIYNPTTEEINYPVSGFVLDFQSGFKYTDSTGPK